MFGKWLRGRRAFTAAELLVVTTILTSFGAGGGYVGVMDKGRQQVCASNLRQLGLAIKMFAMDNDGRLPNAVFFPNPQTAAKDPRNIRNILWPYVKNQNLFLCPSAPEGLKKIGITYVWNDRRSGQLLDSIKDPSNTLLMIDAVSALGKPAHLGGYNILYADCHVKWSPRGPNWHKAVRPSQ